MITDKIGAICPDFKQMISGIATGPKVRVSLKRLSNGFVFAKNKFEDFSKEVSVARQDFTQNTSNQNFGSLEKKEVAGNSVQKSIHGQREGRGASSSSQDEDLQTSDTSTSTPSSIGSRSNREGQTSDLDSSSKSSH